MDRISCCVRSICRSMPLSMPLSILFLLLTACGGSTSGATTSSQPPDNSAPAEVLSIPSLTIAAENKQLKFSWTSIAGASYFKLQENKDGESGFHQIGGNIPASQRDKTLDIAVHLLDWENSRYLIEACDATICVSSSEAGVESLFDTAITELIASDSLNGFEQDQTFWSRDFGSRVAISADGATLAIADIDADINQGVLQESAGLVFIYKKLEGIWTQHTILAAPNTGTDDHFGYSLSLNGNGTVLAVGVPQEDGASHTVNDVNIAEDAGAVYVFRRTMTGAWQFSDYLKADTITAHATFGHSIAIDSTGDTLAIGSPGDSSSAMGIDSIERNQSVSDAGAAYVFSYDGTSWTQQTYLKSNETAAYSLFGDSVDISNDGDTLAVSAYYDGEHGSVYWFTRNVNRWQGHTVIEPTAPIDTRNFGRGLALSGDGSCLIIGATLDHSAFGGVNGDRNDTSATNSGAVFAYTRADNSWVEDAYIKAALPEMFTYFGMRTAVNNDGKRIAIKTSGRDVSVFEKNDQGQWQQTRHLSSSPEKSLALDGEGTTLVLPGVGAISIY